MARQARLNRNLGGFAITDFAYDDHIRIMPQYRTQRREAAKFLDLKECSLYGKIHKKDVPYIKRGGRVYFIKSDLLQYLKEGKQKTAVEIEAEAELHLLTLEEAEKTPAGRGREEPDALPEPKYE